MEKLQKTIKQPVSLTGAGLHTGKDVIVTFKPTNINKGLSFKRIDLEGEPMIPVDVKFVTQTARGTTLEKRGASVMTIEHCLSAIKSAGIDNLIIEVNQPELPILDGSAIAFVEAIEKAGVVEQNAPQIVYNISKPITYREEDSGVELTAYPCDKMQYTVLVDYGTKVLGSQHASLSDFAQYKEEIASSRTFVFLEEMQPLIDNNLIKGGDFSNAVVFVNNIPSDEELDRLAAFFNQPNVGVEKDGILNNCSLRFSNEPARHKLLDIIGDLTLVGLNFNAHIVAKLPGHKVNTEFAKKIRATLDMSSDSRVPTNAMLNTKPLFEIDDIRKRLPHRYPFLLVDRIYELSDSHIIGVKNVTNNEPFFQGHFPEEPVMPGVLLIEAMAQCGGVLALDKVDEPERYSTYFMKIDNVRFRKKVIPGDTVFFRLDLISPIRRGLVNMQGRGYVNGEPVIEAEMLAQVAKNK